MKTIPLSKTSISDAQAKIMDELEGGESLARLTVPHFFKPVESERETRTSEPADEDSLNNSVNDGNK